MKKIFKEYGGVITTVMAIVALIGVIGLLFNPGGTGWMDGAFQDVIGGFGEKVENAIPGEGTTGGSGDSGSVYDPNAPELNPSGVIPSGGVYYVGVTSTATGDYTGATAVYTEGDVFPATVNDCDVYVYGDYEYRYNQGYADSEKWVLPSSQNGWGVRVLNNTKTEYGAILETINGHDIKNVSRAFRGCVSMTIAPVIPSKVARMARTYGGCSSLRNAPNIPSGVTDMAQTFEDCSLLESAPIIPSGVTKLYSLFSGCSSLKTYVGSTDADGDFSGYVLPEGVTGLTSVFSGCSLLTIAPSIPSGVTEMVSAFKDCTSLTNEGLPVIPEGVTMLAHTFEGCTSLTDASHLILPSKITLMYGAFAGCTALTTAPVIPSSVTEMTEVFYGCTSLTGTITIHAQPTSYYRCFAETVKDIVLTGDSTMKKYLANTATNGNVTVSVSA
ncbi:MAG: leucine-rich repeat domain-containing protein [Bacteroidaceae bacterium]|nr:leucine-rich repeat domain-containing protein [Bacteroidaceae bacterium]